MIGSFVITLREGIEAALIVGIVLGYLRKAGAKDLLGPVYVSVLLAILASVGAGALFVLLGAEFEGQSEQVFEGVTMLLAAAMLTYMILWMRKNSRQYSNDFKSKVDLAVTKGQTYGLALLVFVSILREGIETVLFLGSASFTSTGAQVLIGGLLGLLLAAVIGIAIMRYSVRLDLKTFFNVTGIILIFFAAGLVARAIGEFQEAGLIPSGLEHLWDSNWLISGESALGGVLGALFGYTSSPSLAQVMGYSLYWVLIVVWLYRDSVEAFFKKTFASVRPT